MLSREDEIWNRAAMKAGGQNPAEGDVHLASALRLHSLAMNGGVLHALQVLTDQQRRAAIDGYRYFGFHKVADLLSEPFADTDEDDTRLENAYSIEIPLDETLFNAFCAKYAVEPAAFAA